MAFRLVLSAFVLCLLPYTCLSWGSEGHKIIAQIANDMLTSSASSAVGTFLGSYSMTDVAPMADSYDHTSAGKWSAPCHYCNLPRGATNFQMSYCGTYCVVKSIQNYTKILTGEASNPFQCDVDPQDGVEPCALMFLIHYVGDSHQPLHVGYGDDRGGNSVKVSWYGSSTNLHSVWDDSIIEKWDTSFSDAASQLEQIMAANSSMVQYYASTLDPIGWADESFYFVRTTCYNYNQQGRAPADTPQLGDAYYNRNLPIVQERLIAAGVRLGTILNQML